MNRDAITAVIKRNMPDSDNKIVNTISNEIRSLHLVACKEQVKKAKVEYEAKGASLHGGGDGKSLQHYLDHPLDAECEEKLLRARLHMNLESDDQLNSQLLSRISDIIGIKKAEDVRPILVVDFRTAFPDLAGLIAICEKPAPVIKEEE